MGVSAATRQITAPVTIVAMCGVRKRGWTCAEDAGQQAVAGHGHEDPRLAEEQHQQHAGHAGQTAGGRSARWPPSAGLCSIAACLAKATAIGAFMSISG